MSASPRSHARALPELDLLRRDDVLWPLGIALVAILAAYAPSPASILLIAVACLLAGVMPRHGIVALPATLAWFHEPVAVGGQAFPASELLLVAVAGGCAIAWLVRLLNAHQRLPAIDDLRRVLLDPLVVVLCMLALVGALLALRPYDPGHRGDALREWRWVLAEPLLFVLLLRYQARQWSRSLSLHVLLAMLAGAALASALALGDIATGGGVVADGSRRIAGPFPHPNALALYIARATVLGAALVAVRRIDLRRDRLLLALTALCALATLATLSRGGVLALLIGGALLATLFGRRERLALAGAAGAALLALLLVARDRMLDAFGGGSASLRLDIWRSAREMIGDRPITGYGPDQFLYAYLPRYVRPEAWNERFTAHAHNFMADAWIRLGIIGALSALLLLAFTVRGGWQVARHNTTSQARTDDITPEALRRATMVAVVALVAHGLIDNALFAHDLAMSAALLLWATRAPGPADAASQARGRGVVDARPDRRWGWLHRFAPVRQPAG